MKQETSKESRKSFYEKTFEQGQYKKMPMLDVIKIYSQHLGANRIIIGCDLLHKQTIGCFTEMIYCQCWLIFLKINLEFLWETSNLAKVPNGYVIKANI